MPDQPFIPKPENEKPSSPELSEAPTAAQFIEACRDVLSPDDCAEIEAMADAEDLDSEDLEGFVFSILISNGIGDPAGFLAEQGILEPLEGVPSLPESLGLVETPELTALHARLVEALRTSQDVAQHAVAYQTIAEALVDRMEDYVVGQIALTLQLGLIAQEAGQQEMYAGYLEQARTYAYNLGLNELVATIDALIEAA